MPVPLQVQAGPAAGVPVVAMGAPGPLPGACCAYCQAPHAMKHCQEFHRMLTSIYQVGWWGAGSGWWRLLCWRVCPDRSAARPRTGCACAAGASIFSCSSPKGVTHTGQQ